MATGRRLKCRAVLPACVALLLVGGATPVAAAEPRVPVVFVHGLGGDATAWGSFGEVLTKQGWKFGGCPQVDRKTWRVSNVCPAGTLSSGDFYRIQFSGNQSLTLKEQGEELRTIVASVVAINRGQAVALVAHSMGGLAARSYLQLLRGEGVQRLITIGTPHGGAELSVICQEFRFVCDAARIDAAGIGVAELRPDSAAMLTLNDLRNHPLPRKLSYVSIIGTGTPVRVATSEDGDGIVTVRAQNLGLLAGATALNHSARSVSIGECGKGPQTHTCELVDRGVWSLVLSNLREQVGKSAEAQMAQTTTDPRPLTKQSDAPAQLELTFRMRDGSTVTGQVQAESIKVKSSVGTATVPVKDMVSFSDGQLRLKDGSVLKGELVAASLNVASKYGKLELKSKEIAWFGVGTPPAVAATAPTQSPQAPAAKPPGSPASSGASGTSSQQRPSASTPSSGPAKDYFLLGRAGASWEFDLTFQRRGKPAANGLVKVTNEGETSFAGSTATRIRTDETYSESERQTGSYR